MCTCTHTHGNCNYATRSLMDIPRLKFGRYFSRYNNLLYTAFCKK